jgi:hypothetical protein
MGHGDVGGLLRDPAVGQGKKRNLPISSSSGSGGRISFG